MFTELMVILWFYACKNKNKKDIYVGLSQTLWLSSLKVFILSFHFQFSFPWVFVINNFKSISQTFLNCFFFLYSSDVIGSSSFSLRFYLCPIHLSFLCFTSTSSLFLCSFSYSSTQHFPQSGSQFIMYT